MPNVSIYKRVYGSCVIILILNQYDNFPVAPQCIGSDEIAADVDKILFFGGRFEDRLSSSLSVLGDSLSVVLH